MPHAPSRPDPVSYPCTWLYKIIGLEPAAMRGAVCEAVRDAPYTMQPSKVSSKGRYCSFNVEVHVQSARQRDAVYEFLRTHPAIKYLL